MINGDVFTDYDVSSLMQLHLQPGEAHLVLIENPPHNLDGDFTLSHLSPDSQKYTFSGISRYQADFFNGLEPGIRPLGPLLREKLSKHLVSTELYIGNWDDVGTPARLTALNERLA